MIQGSCPAEGRRRHRSRKGGCSMIRRHASTFVVAAVTAAVMAGVPALAGLRGTAAGTTIPVVKSAYRNGPVTVPNANAGGQIAHLALPAGKWAVFAKTYVHNAGSSAGPVECTLVAGGDFDRSRADLESNAGGAHEDV